MRNDPTSQLLHLGNGRLVTRFTFGDGTTRDLPLLRGGDGDAPTLEDLLERVAGITDVTDVDELTTLDADITAAAVALAEAGNMTDEVLAQLQAAGEACQSIRARQEELDADATARADQAAAALALIRGENPDDDPDPAADPADDPAADPAPVATDDPAPVETDPAPDPAADPELEPIAASAPRPTRVTRVAARRPVEATPAPSAPVLDLPSLGLTASANAPGVAAGSAIETYDQLASAFVSAFDTASAYRGPRVKVPIVRAGSETASQYADEFSLDSDRRANGRKIEAVQAAIQRAGAQSAGGIQASANSQMASGGICAPQNVSYDLPVLGTEARPVRDQFLTRFGADRGGVATLPPPVLEQLGGAIGVWTEATDQNPGSAVKPCLTVTCPNETETVVEAVTKCIETGNFRARYFPEQVEAWMRLAAVAHARKAEERLLAKIATGSTAVTSGTVLGTTRDVLSSLDRAISVWQYRHRTDDGFTLQWGAPRWLRDQIRTDIARQLPVGSLEETLAVADATIQSFFATRNVSPVWLNDGESGQRFGVQGPGPLQGWPSTVKTYLAPAGNWLFVDGGSLELGMVRDSSLNSTNDVQFFAETFEGAHFHGQESWTFTIDTCPDGSVSATIDINPCASGS